MGYRDEKASLRARVTELEAKLAEKDETIARLQGRLREDATADTAHSRVLDAPMTFTLERTLDHEVTTEGLEAIAQVLRERLRLPVSQVGRTVRGELGTVQFELTMADGQTDLRIEATYHDRRNGFFVAGPMAGLMACLFAGGALASAGVAPLVMAGGLALVGGLSPLGLLKLVRGVVEKEQTNIAGTFAAVLALAEAHAEAPEEAIRARVATDGQEVPAPVEVAAEEPGDAEASA